jgi:antitoxin YefM
MTHTLTITQARQNLPNLVGNAHKKLDEYVITVNGIPQAVLMSLLEYESWKETQEIMSDPGLMKAIKQGEKDIEAGRVYDWEDVKKELFGSKDVQTKNHSKSKKRA